MKHKQLTFEQRDAIEQMLKNKRSKKSIISTLELFESTFYCKLKRKDKKRVYNAKLSQMLAEERKKTHHYKLIFITAMESIIKDEMVNNQWYLEQILAGAETKL